MFNPGEISLIALDPSYSLFSFTLFSLAGVGLWLYGVILRRWMSVLRELGFRTSTTWFPTRGFRASGFFSGQEFDIRGKGQDSSASFLIEITLAQNVLDRMHCEPADININLSMLVRTKGISVGDQSFDSKVWVSGEQSELVTAVLDESSRKEVRNLMGSAGAGIRGGRISFRYRFQRSAHVRQEILEMMGGYLRLLAQWSQVARDVPSSLERNVIHDPLSRVRINNFFVLDNLSRPRSIALAETLTADPDAWVRLVAGALAGEKGLSTFVRGLDDPEVDPKIAAESVRQAAKNRGLSAESFFTLIQHTLDAFSPIVRSAGVVLLENIPVEKSLGLMWERVDREADSAVLRAFVEQVSVSAFREGERILISCLQKKDREVRMAAARRLAEVGTPRSLEALDMTGRTMDVPLAMAARSSAYEIRKRIDPSQRGFISVTDLQEQGGGLSMESGESGALSFRPSEETAPSTGKEEPEVGEER